MHFSAKLMKVAVEEKKLTGTTCLNHSEGKEEEKKKRRTKTRKEIEKRKDSDFFFFSRREVKEKIVSTEVYHCI
jgi:hypothetical protein